MPRSKNIWVFGAWYGQQYSDNTSYLFEYVNKNKNDIKSIWLTKKKNIYNLLKDKGYNVFYVNSFLGISILAVEPWHLTRTSDKPRSLRYSSAFSTIFSLSLVISRP